ncbi:MAG: hypothetical protein HOP15_15395 [Planctomycetes bacterium]|nr:hypothetical protein [Planctomycetota bacterium]
MASLWKECGQPLSPPLVLASASMTLAAGLCLPVVTLRSGLVHDSYSVLGGIADLVRSGEVLLALIVLAFSVLFPIGKLGALVLALFLPHSGAGEEQRRAHLARPIRLACS